MTATIYHYAGLRVIVSDLLTKQPAIQLSAKVGVSDAFRSQMDAWLLETFGTKHVMQGDTIVMHSEVARRLKEQGQLKDYA